MQDKTIHKMKLQPEPFEKIKAGTKVVEIRLNDEKRQHVKIGDEIEFSPMANGENKIKTEVTGLKIFPTFKDLFHTYEPKKYGGESADEYEKMYQYYSLEDEEKYGVLGIELKYLSE